MKQYQKIQTVYFRDPENNHKTLLEGTFAKPEFELLKDINWICTEKNRWYKYTHNVGW